MGTYVPIMANPDNEPNVQRLASHANATPASAIYAHNGGPPAHASEGRSPSRCTSHVKRLNELIERWKSNGWGGVANKKPPRKLSPPPPAAPKPPTATAIPNPKPKPNPPSVPNLENILPPVPIPLPTTSKPMPLPAGVGIPPASAQTSSAQLGVVAVPQVEQRERRRSIDEE